MRNPTHEQALTKAGLQFEYIEAVPVSEINATRGKQMQARLQPLDHDLIDRYDEMLQAGFEPPPLLFWKPGRGMYVPLDGNQRIAANSQTPAKHRRKSFSAYVIKTDDQMIVDRLCWTWNNMVNGRRLSYEECLEHALTFVRKYGQAINAAAKEWGVKAWELTARVTEEEMRELAMSKRIYFNPNTDKNVFLELHTLRRLGDDVALKAMKVSADNGLSQKQVQVLTKEVREARTSDAKIKIVDDFASRPEVLRHKAETKNGTVKVQRERLPRMQLQKQLDQLEYFFGKYGDKNTLKPLGKEDRERYAGAALTCCNRLIEIYGLGSFINGQGA